MIPEKMEDYTPEFAIGAANEFLQGWLDTVEQEIPKWMREPTDDMESVLAAFLFAMTEIFICKQRISQMAQGADNLLDTLEKMIDQKDNIIARLKMVDSELGADALAHHCELTVKQLESDQE
jgi:hypothetical protein